MEERKHNIFEGEFWRVVLDQLNTNIYITDIETDKIVYMNDTMKETFHLENPEGEFCWKVLQKGMKRRCSFCKIKELMSGKDVCVWNGFNTKKERVYKNYDSLIRHQGKVYHMHNSTDVTEYMELSESASIDDLTKVLNRGAGKKRLENAIEKAKKEDKLLSVALYDVNELKRVNDRFGHSEGDRMICYIADTVKACLTKEDIMFRLSGDEFILMFYNLSFVDAEARIKQVLNQLSEDKEKTGIYYDVSFSFGLIEIYPSDNYTVPDIIAKADEKMYIQKRNFHIMRSKEKLIISGTDYEDEKYFEYDKNRLYDALVDSTDEYIFVGNMQTGVFQYPQSMVEEFGLPGSIVENAAAFWSELIHPHDEKVFLESNQEIADGRVESHCIEYRARNVKGEWIWLRCRGHMLRDDQGIPSLFAGFITNLGRKNRIDHTTRISNRFTFEGDIKTALIDKNSVNRIGMMLLDLDSFKNINDLYSHSFGDEVLRVTARKINALLPSNATIYRLDGDEFGIVFINGNEEDDLKVYKNIQSKFYKQQEYNSRKYFCTVSAGYAAFPSDGKDYLTLFKCSNLALEYSKQQGKNKITRFSLKILQEKERKLELSELLRESVERNFNGFSVFYQPQVDTNTKELYGAEALARYHCSKYGDVSPGEFIPILEQNGLIVPLGRWVLRNAIKQCKHWCMIKNDFHISVNLSYIQLLEGDMIQSVKNDLHEFAFAPENLTLELTETYLIKEEASTREIMEQFHEIGIQLAMDDFGTGYSSLVSLKHIPVDIVKIDRGFVKGITSDVFNSTFVRSIKELCHDVGKKVCLEGIETEEEYNVIKDIGVELIQGFYFGYPISADMFEIKWL